MRADQSSSGQCLHHSVVVEIPCRETGGKGRGLLSGTPWVPQKYRAEASSGIDRETRSLRPTRDRTTARRERGAACASNPRAMG